MSRKHERATPFGEGVGLIAGFVLKVAAGFVVFAMVVWLVLS